MNTKHMTEFESVIDCSNEALAKRVTELQGVVCALIEYIETIQPVALEFTTRGRQFVNKSQNTKDG